MRITYLVFIINTLVVKSILLTSSDEPPIKWHMLISIIGCGLGIFLSGIVHISAMKANTIMPMVDRINAGFKVILGSGSPRRKELVALMGFNSFTIKASTFAEDLDHSLFPTPELYCLETARKKIEQVSADIGVVNDKTLLIGADTIVEIDGRILEKPRDSADSSRMLHNLSNRDHRVHTAVVVFSNSRDLEGRSGHPAGALTPLISFVETTKVSFCDLTDSDIDAYVASGEGMDKAGSYGIQGGGSLFVKGIDGCYFNVMGFPVHRLSQELAAVFCPK